METPAFKADKVVILLGTRPGQNGYEAAVAWVTSLDREAKLSWDGEKTRSQNEKGLMGLSACGELNLLGTPFPNRAVLLRTALPVCD